MDQSKSGSSNKVITIIGIVALLCCICLIAAGVGGYFFYRFAVQSASEIGLPIENPFVPATPTRPAPVTRPSVDSISPETMNTLSQTVVPVNDLYELACQLRQVCNVPTTLPAPAVPFKVGDQQKFWVSNVDTNDNFQVTATLRYITAHSYFWAQNSVKVNEDDMKKLMDTFENKLYPTDREFFGSEWTPGVDNDPHVYVLYASGTGASNAGYFSSPDEYNPKVHKYSNGHEMFVFNADNVALNDQYTYGTLAHEFQHMIHWNQDRNESTWMNEGFSVLAEYLNGYPAFFDFDFITNPNLNLTDWLPDPGSNGPHYGASFLFLDYFLDRFGDKATQAVVHDQENGLTSIDDTLKNLNITDKTTGQPVTADDVVIDWMVTNYLKDSSVGDGRFFYHNYASSPQASATTTISTCPQSATNYSVNQYGAEYIKITCAGDHTLTFTGSTIANLLPADPHSGKYAFWSNKGDESDMTLTREFDLTSVSGPVQLSYWTWYDLEQGYDYLYVEASTDGKSWDILKTPSGTDKDKSGNSYGWAYTGKSGGGDSAQWLNEKVDLSAYAGKKIQVRFEYVTDAAVNGEGLLLDDVSIAAINYSSDFEADDGGWQANGFARVDNALPQTYRLALISYQDKTTVQYITLNADQTADIPLSLKSGQSAVLVVTGTQRFTRLPAGYLIEIK
jgi:immune inhibitor A